MYFVGFDYMPKYKYSILKNYTENFSFKHNLKLSKSQKAKLLYLGGNEFIRRKIEECWNELILEDDIALEIEGKKDWDLILEKLKVRGTGYFQNIKERISRN